MISKNPKQQIQAFILLSALILLFQNCSGGFSTLDFLSGTSTESSTATSETADPTAKLLYQASISELQSITVKLDGMAPLTFPDGFPKGAVYDPQSRRFNWIPRRGQEGSYKINVLEGGTPKGFIELQVAALTDRQLQVGGPPYFYRDGEVGYIFVHGAGDIDRCANRADLLAYWGAGPEIVAPDGSNRLLACYDSRKAVANVAKDVANQILNAKCGQYNKCIIFTHSMGGLLMEHMFLHTREARPSDAEPLMYQNRELFKAVRERTLFVVSLASAAGGSKAASIVNRDGPRSLGQEAVGAISRVMGENTDSTRNLVVSYASNVVAPFNEDPEIPFFMIPGFTERTAGEESGFIGSFFNVLIDSVPRIVFNGDRSLATLDSVTSFQSRSDGLVDFRSACGIASDSENEGPGRNILLDTHFRYCWSARKKANHYVWFLSNLNHYLITGLAYQCRDSNVPCVALFPDETNGTYSLNRNFTGLNAMEVVRLRLGSPAQPAQMLLRGLASLPDNDNSIGF